MPYFVHLKGLEPTFGSLHTSRTTAYEEVSTRSDHPIVTFKISEEERSAWQQREADRFYDEVYRDAPWTEHGVLHPSFKSYDYENLQYPPHPTDSHFVHLSLEHPGMVAYTPSDEHGYQDRQVRIKVGKYLEQYLTDVFTRTQIAGFVDKVKGYSAPLQLARTADDIEQVYVNGPQSCMSKPARNYRSYCHPVRVYGDSDLAVAYLGTLDEPKARCIVWPEKKRYCRVYGDSTLKTILEREGFTCETSSHLDYGSLDGAKVHALYDSRKHTYVMPYVDGANSADLEGKYFVLREDSDGEYDVRNSDYVHGLIAESLPNNCERCERAIGADETLCSSCEADHMGSCERCGDDMYDGDAYTEYEGSLYCENCIDRVSTTCDDCGERIYRGRDYCDDCRLNHYAYCEVCESEYDSDDNDHCPSCPDPEEDEEDESTPYIPVPVPTPFVELRNHDGTAVHRVEAITRIGTFAVHSAFDSGFTITHVHTGLAVITLPTLERAITLARRLHDDPACNWSFRRRSEMTDETQTHSTMIIGAYRAELEYAPATV